MDAMTTGLADRTPRLTMDGHSGHTAPGDLKSSERSVSLRQPSQGSRRTVCENSSGSPS